MKHQPVVHCVPEEEKMFPHTNHSKTFKILSSLMANEGDRMKRMIEDGKLTHILCFICLFVFKFVKLIQQNDMVPFDNRTAFIVNCYHRI